MPCNVSVRQAELFHRSFDQQAFPTSERLVHVRAVEIGDPRRTNRLGILEVAKPKILGLARFSVSEFNEHRSALVDHSNDPDTVLIDQLFEQSWGTKVDWSRRALSFLVARKLPKRSITQPSHLELTDILPVVLQGDRLNAVSWSQGELICCASCSV